MNGTIKVTPEKLTAAAQDFQSQGNNISSLTGEMMNLVTSLNHVWEGEAGQAYITKFKGLEDDIQLMIKMINEHVTDLNEMAREYQTTESSVMDEINTLSSDVIV